MLKLYSVIDIFLLKITYLLSNLGLYRVFYKRSFSQEGEDMILSNLFVKDYPGFYVDIGAHHPYRLSNTYFFYQLGWKGINIEPNPYLIKLFSNTRGRDINLNMAIGKKRSIKDYYMFSEPALNGFLKKIVNVRDGADIKSCGSRKIKVVPLSEVLDKYCREKNIDIDILSIDTEGMEYEVLSSNNWHRYRPKSIVVEILGTNIEELTSNRICLFLKKLDYIFYAKSGNSCIFLEKSFIYSLFN